jgi:hypothetical protein
MRPGKARYGRRENVFPRQLGFAQHIRDNYPVSRKSAFDQLRQHLSRYRRLDDIILGRNGQIIDDHSQLICALPQPQNGVIMMKSNLPLVFGRVFPEQRIPMGVQIDGINRLIAAHRSQGGDHSSTGKSKQRQVAVGSHRMRRRRQHIKHAVRRPDF